VELKYTKDIIKIDTNLHAVTLIIFFVNEVKLYFLFCIYVYKTLYNDSIHRQVLLYERDCVTSAEGTQLSRTQKKHHQD